MSALLTQLETAVQQLLQQNSQLKQQLNELNEQHELLQLDVMEKEEQQNAATARMQSLLDAVNAGNG
ncbi:hypothetical protein MN202_11125 [Rheinheimera muenzenbergensis]|uniref:Cell division protein ZapB n=1 Tax=Rheinheimera muenzenbergensis TaxID=1193628 RepID=A0ABU8C775_9GAMM|nr:hypothetical protein [Gammaproteobacteria bacterium]MBU1554233.1 hypothetical protein [Gammaproteobacteria bacterium]MBU2072694.1 hypothetical protein [Gammaproteobacteria bacterium]MBU2182172.1 hypothetical protein [Gammaproteobacteria bacterium]MBU2204786.1 hypothetical protein [Gammaproteobacteria bacterium]